MEIQKILPAIGLLLVAGQSSAGTVPMGSPPTPMALELGGIAAVAAISLIIATQLIKRRK